MPEGGGCVSGCSLTHPVCSFPVCACPPAQILPHMLYHVQGNAHSTPLVCRGKNNKEHTCSQEAVCALRFLKEAGYGSSTRFLAAKQKPHVCSLWRSILVDLYCFFFSISHILKSRAIHFFHLFIQIGNDQLKGNLPIRLVM